MFLAINKPFYIFTIILIAICLLYILYTLIIYPAIRKQIIKNKLIKYATLHHKQVVVTKCKVDDASLKIKIDEKVYYAKVIYVSKNCDLQINNIDTWVCYKKASADTYKHKFISNLSTFMKSKLDNRIVILAKKAKTIKKVINECEMIMVNPETDVYKVKVINFDNLEHLFK